MIRNIDTNKNEVSIYMMFYPIAWDRHCFDYCNEEQVIGKVKELGKGKVTFCKWGDMDVDDDGECRSAEVDQDFFNDWDDCPIYDEEYADDENEDKKSALETIGQTEDFVKSHWCLAVTEEVKDGILYPIEHVVETDGIEDKVFEYKDGTFTAFWIDEDGEIQHAERRTLENAKEVLKKAHGKC